VSEVVLPAAPLTLPGVPTPRLGSRELFPTVAFDSFLAHAAISPTNLASVRAAEECLKDVARSGAAVFPRWMAQRERLRNSIAELLGTSSACVALTSGCTPGITSVALSLPWKSGETLLTFAGEFPANVIPWQEAARRAGGHVEILDLPAPGEEDCSGKIVTRIADAIETERGQGRAVRFLAVSAVEFQTGLRLPLEALGQLCEEKDVRFLVDGIQACGVMPLDVEALKIDAFFTGAHKWLISPEGTGFFTASERLLDELQPATVGWLSYEDSELFLFHGAGHLKYERELRKRAQLFEGSTLNSTGFAALEGGIDVCRSVGPARTFEHVQSLHDGLEPVFVANGFRSLRSPDQAMRSCLLSFEPPQGLDLMALASALRERGVMISIPDGRVRLSPHFANSMAEVAVVESALSEALRAIS